MTSVLMADRKEKTWRRAEGPVKTKAEIERCNHQPRNVGSQQKLQEQEGFSLEHVEGAWLCGHLNVELQAPELWGKISITVSQLVGSHLFRHPWETNIPIIPPTHTFLLWYVHLYLAEKRSKCASRAAMGVHSGRTLNYSRWSKGLDWYLRAGRAPLKWINS